MATIMIHRWYLDATVIIDMATIIDYRWYSEKPKNLTHSATTID